MIIACRQRKPAGMAVFCARWDGRAVFLSICMKYKNRYYSTNKCILANCNSSIYYYSIDDASRGRYHRAALASIRQDTLRYEGGAGLRGGRSGAAGKGFDFE